MFARATALAGVVPAAADAAAAAAAAERVLKRVRAYVSKCLITRGCTVYILTRLQVAKLVKPLVVRLYEIDLSFELRALECSPVLKLLPRPLHWIAGEITQIQQTGIKLLWTANCFQVLSCKKSLPRM